MIASCAFRSRAADISFIARVIFWVFLTEEIRLRMALREGMGAWLRLGRVLDREGLGELGQGVADLLLHGVVELAGGAQAVEQRLLAGAQELQQLALVAADGRHR